LRSKPQTELPTILIGILPPAALYRSAIMAKTEIDQTEKYIRATCEELDTVYDREAVSLMCTVGIFATDDPAQLGEAVERLRGNAVAKRDEAIRKLEQRIRTEDTTDAREKALRMLSDLQDEELTDTIDTACLLGIAVGRRIGPGALRPRAAGRR
jgi:hypothetical protein